MHKARNGLRAFGLCLIAALGLMAFFAVGAQAEPNSHWNENGNPIAGNVQVQASLEGHALLLTEVGGQPVEILCEVLTTKDALLEPGGKNSGTLNFSKCNTKLEGSISPECKPEEPIVAEVLSLLVLHTLEGGAKDDLILFAPHPGKAFTHIHFSELCSLEINEEEGIPITGEIFVKDCQNEGTVEKTEHLIEEARKADGKPLLGGLNFGVHPAQLDGSAIIELVTGELFSGTWA